MTAEENKTVRCVIYTRKSTEEGLDKEFNSLEAQYDACASYIQSQTGRGWALLDRHYDDGGYSGGNMDRPALQILLRDVAEHNVDAVVVYKLDRISRSLSDFTEMSRLFAKYDVSLISVTQQIDTSSSMGRMIVNLLMSFSQFEREMTSDRVRDKMAAARRKGMWTGDVVPYGYTLENRQLSVCPEQAERVRYAYERYDTHHSFLQVTREVNEKYGAWKDGKPWNIMHIRALLKNATVAGKVRDTHTQELYEGRHEAIVPFELWSRVQDYILEHARGKRERKTNAHIVPLKGVIKCGYCGCAMVPTFCNSKSKRVFFYYRCDATHKHLTETCQLKNIAASAIEGPVFDLIGKLITNEYFLQLVAGEDTGQLETLRRLGKDKARFIQAMTNAERQRLVQLFIRNVTVFLDGIDILVRGDGFRNLMWKGNGK